MSKPLHARAAAAAFAAGEVHIRTHGALTFVGDVAFSYAEPVAVRQGGKLLVTTAKFSVTTSRHTGQVAGAFAVAHQIVDYNADRSVGTGRDGYAIHNVDHGVLRRVVRDLGLGAYLGRMGQHYERPGFGAAA